MLAPLLLAFAVPAWADGVLPYGTRVGMTVEIVSSTGLDTAHAVIEVRRTREYAGRYCADYERDGTEACVDKVMKDPAIGDAVAADCETGRFTNLVGERLVFGGANVDHDAAERATEYRIVPEGGRTALGGTMASGYAQDVEQFKALCPMTFGMAEIAFRDRPKYIGRWYIGDRAVCRQADGEGEGLLTYRSKEFRAIETKCDVRSVRAVGGKYALTLTCSGEGEKPETRRETLEVRQSRLDRTLVLDGRTHKFTYDRCP